MFLILALWGGYVNYLPYQADQIIEGQGVSQIIPLSNYNEALKNTVFDTPIYVIGDNQAGGRAVILGGSHANEISGVIASILMVEYVEVELGQLFVIPHANASAMTNHLPLRGEPFQVEIPFEQTARYFRYGARLTNPLHQWPDPTYFDHPHSEMEIRGSEIRNLNRVHPGENDTMTQAISKAIVELVKAEGVDLIFDFHEAPPQSRLANNIIVNPKTVELGAEVVLNLQFENLNFQLDVSSEYFRGLSHREFGDWTSAEAILTETANPYQGAFFIDTSYQAIYSGDEKGYAQRFEQVRFPHTVYGDLPLANRVGRQLAIVNEFLQTYSMYNPQRSFITNIPSYHEVSSQGIGSFLNWEGGGGQ